MQKKYSSLLIAAILLLSQAGWTASLDAVTQEHRVWQCSEFKLQDLPRFDTPYDPDVVAVDVSFTGPSGKAITVPAFWYAPFTRTLENNREQLSPAGAPGWRVRFTPLEEGEHQGTVKVTQEGTTETMATDTFNVLKKKANAHGFVRVEPKKKRYFQFDDQTPLVLIGENLCWHGKRGTFDYDDWFGGYASAGMNYTRLWMWQVGFGLEIRKGEILNYNQKTAWQLDYVLQQAADQGINVMLCFDYHGIFWTEPDMWGGNNYWPKHPYNKANGGPCATQNEFFTSPEARKLYRKRLRYIVARYAALPSIMAWEFFNEIDHTFEMNQKEDVIRWHNETAQWLRDIDPYNHLITTSCASPAGIREFWQLDSLDYSQVHRYMNWPSSNVGAAHVAAGIGHRYPQLYDKPCYLGEFGTYGGNAGTEHDPHFRGLRQALWGCVMGGTAGTAMPWWWEAIHAENLYPLWGALTTFLKDTNVGTAAWEPREIAVGDKNTLYALALGDGTTTLVYAVDPAFHYPHGSQDEAMPRTGTRFTLEDMKKGTYTITWWHPETGKVFSQTEAKARKGALEVDVPTFTVDIVAKIQK